jgi:spore coat polysaccharide biosynthesis protein SpsF
MPFRWLRDHWEAYARLPSIRLEKIMTRFKTEQEKFWAGDFGKEYIARNTGDSSVAANLAFLAKALSRCRNIHSCIEFGANIGLNLRALRLLLPNIELFAVEINPAAAAELRKFIPESNVFCESILSPPPPRFAV